MILLNLFAWSLAAQGMQIRETIPMARSQAELVRTAIMQLEGGTVGCDYPATSGLLQGLGQFNDRALDLSAMAFSNRSGDGTRYIARRTLAELVPIISDAQLNLADALLRRQCFDEADSLYRQVFTTYSAPAYTGISRRAQLGIDDVRSARGVAAALSVDQAASPQNR